MGMRVKILAMQGLSPAFLFSDQGWQAANGEKLSVQIALGDSNPPTFIPPLAFCQRV